MKKIDRLYIVIVMTLALMFLVSALAHSFQFTLKNEIGDPTRYWIFHRADDNDPASAKLLVENNIGKDEATTFDLEIVKPGVYLLVWLVPSEKPFGESWIAFWIYEDWALMEVRLVRGAFTPKQIIKVVKGSII